MFLTHASSNAPTHLAAGTPFSTSGGDAPRLERRPAAGLDRGEAARKPRALVVDDAPDVAEMVGMMMRVAGYEVETALSAPAALELASAAHFDVVISDIGMPMMNGYEFAERLRLTPGYAAVPLIAVTGFTMYDDRARALTAGFDDFLAKPINTHDLLGAVERLRK
ncbi:MAG TPA: response regulator [Pyrinomonadaceae bacterium]|nr:response regulator [Pyrinomonadaceae bacterium]